MKTKTTAVPAALAVSTAALAARAEQSAQATAEHAQRTFRRRGYDLKVALSPQGGVWRFGAVPELGATVRSNCTYPRNDSPFEVPAGAAGRVVGYAQEGIWQYAVVRFIAAGTRPGGKLLGRYILVASVDLASKFEVEAAKCPVCAAPTAPTAPVAPLEVKEPPFNAVGSNPPGTYADLTPGEPAPAKLVPPLVHLNGSGSANLLPPLEAQVKLLVELQAQLRQSGPHMRDYYPRPTGEADFKAAVEAHRARLTTLAAMQDELEALWAAIDAQGN